MKKAIPVIVVIAIAIIVTLVLITRQRESIYVGTIEVTKVDISPRVASIIKARPVDEGYAVKEGDQLFVLSCEDIAVQLEKMQSEYARAQKLRATGTMADDTYERIKANHDDMALKNLWCDVRSPINGIVLTKYHEVGEWVTPGVKVMTLGDLNDVWAYVYVEQSMLSQLALGQKVVGFLPEINTSIPGTIIHINDESEFTPKNVQTRKERTRLVFGIKIRFENAENLLKPGMPIEVTFPHVRNS